MILDLDRFLDLFQGNPDVVGSDHGRGHEMPGPLPIVGMESWHSALAHHLDGSHGIGVYPWHDGFVRWGCIDFDQGDTESWEHAMNVATVLDATAGVQAWVERSRSKGYHLWVFAPRWTVATLMRRALLAACQMADAPTLEINPKSETLESGQLGNFVRLPYKGWIKHRYLERQVIVDLRDNSQPLSLPRFLERCEPDATVDALKVLARWYVDPNQPPVQPFDKPPPEFTDGGMSALARVIFRNGPKDGQDRSSFLFALANALAEGGMGYDDLMETLRLADEAHGQKYTRRPDAEARYRDLATKALNREMS